MPTTEPLTILTWWWSQPGGRTTYTKDHVLVWRDMIRRNLSMPHRLACVTDLVDEIEGVEIIAPPGDFTDVRIGTWADHMPQCLRRIALFRPDAAEIFGRRFVSMDLDCVVSGPLDPLFERPDDFVMYRGVTTERPYNGSMVMMTAGARPQVYERFTPEGAADAGRRYLGSDQAWISHVLGVGEATWSVQDGVHAWGSRWNAGDPRITFFLTKDKSWDFVAQGERFVEEHYRREPWGRALILGYAPTVWDDAREALKTGPFDAVIASPEAAAHWPRKPDFIANDDAHALRLARMHGFEDFALCGAQERKAAA